MKKILLGRMTWKEVAEAAQCKAPVLIPVGTQENQSQHNIMGLDTYFAATVAERAAERCAAVVAPVMPYGGSAVFAGIPGTITLRPEIQAAVYEDILSCLARHGFDHLLFVNYHLGNDWAVEQACRRLKAKAGLLSGQIQIGNVTRDITKDLYEGKKGVVSHGAEPGTSLMLYLFPQDVRMDLAQKDTLRSYQGFEVRSSTSLKFRGSAVNLYLDMGDTAPIGGFGDPTVAKAEVGKEVVERVVDYVASFVERFKEMDTHVAK